MKIYNSITKQEEVFESLKPGKVSMYTCGPTVYNYAHIGNFFAYLSADTLYRWLKFGENYDVKWVMNITDIDDKTIRDSQKEHPDLEPMEALNKFCRFYEDEFKKDLESLKISLASLNITEYPVFPRATKFIPEQQELVRSLCKNKFAYIADGSVYFNIQAYKKYYHYGQLVYIDPIGFLANDIVKNNQDEYSKENAADFVLWKGYKEGEPFWEFELDGQNLKGRPGWHLECSAMEEAILGVPFDIHTGGCDLKFPHHENEIAQSLGGYGEKIKSSTFPSGPTKYWFHNGHLLVEGEKMSKSKGNFFRLADLMAQGWSAEVIRLAIVTNHYRGDFNFTQNGLHAAKKNLQEIRAIYSALQSGKINFSGAWDTLDKFKAAMNDDLNTSKAFSELLQLVKNIKNSPSQVVSGGEDFNTKKLLEFFDLASNIFGVDFRPQEIQIPEEIKKLAEQQKQFKAEKNFAEADRIRDELKEKGFAWDQRKDEIVKL